jgi:hypothetical protein
MGDWLDISLLPLIACTLISFLDFESVTTFDLGPTQLSDRRQLGILADSQQNAGRRQTAFTDWGG